MRSRAHNIRQHHNHQIQDGALPLSGEDSNTSNDSKLLRALLLQRNMMLVSCIFLLLLLLHSRCGSFSIAAYPFLASNSCRISLGEYHGPVYHSVDSGTVGKPQCLLDSKWMRVSLHTVRFPGSETTFDDWMWIDYHDRINVLVEDENKSGEEQGEEPRFLVFEQTKYALEGRNTLAIIGGIIEAGEDPMTAARREVEEEMNGLICNKFEFLGRHRTDVNRGMGWLNGFLATQCTRDSKTEKHHYFANEVGVADTEKQNLKSITLTELREAVTQGEFIEVQWTATVTLALLKYYTL